MEWYPVKAAASKPKGGPGISASVRTSKHSRTVNLSLTVAAQERFFGRAVDPEVDRFNIARGTGTDAGHLRIALDATGVIPAIKSMKGSIRFRLDPWANTPKDVFKSKACRVFDETADTAVVVLLPWSKMAQNLEAAE